MTTKRYNILDTNPRARFTRKELKRGWHFCWELDGSLESLVPCGCDRPGFKTRLRKVHKKFDRWNRKYNETLAALHDAVCY